MQRRSREEARRETTYLDQLCYARDLLLNLFRLWFCEWQLIRPSHGQLHPHLLFSAVPSRSRSRSASSPPALDLKVRRGGVRRLVVLLLVAVLGVVVLCAHESWTTRGGGESDRRDGRDERGVNAREGRCGGCTSCRGVGRSLWRADGDADRCAQLAKSVREREDESGQRDDKGRIDALSR